MFFSKEKGVLSFNWLLLNLTWSHRATFWTNHDLVACVFPRFREFLVLALKVFSSLLVSCCDYLSFSIMN